jgi:hypothetical protein
VARFKVVIFERLFAQNGTLVSALTVIGKVKKELGLRFTQYKTKTMGANTVKTYNIKWVSKKNELKNVFYLLNKVPILETGQF